MTKHTMDAKHLDKCGNSGCACVIDPGQSYCCDKCEHVDSNAQKTPPESVKTCGCGRGDCK